MNLIRTTLHIGVETPFRVLHMTDTHLTYADLRDGLRKVNLAKSRREIFPEAEALLSFAHDAAKEHQAPILHTGDLIDFVSVANLEAVRKFTAENDCFMSAGNHEFSLYLGECKEDAAYRARSLEKVQAVFHNDIRMASRVIGGVNFVALDSGYYLFETEQLDFLKKECEKGLPIILLMHTPLFDRALYDLMMETEVSAYLVGAPEALMQSYPPGCLEAQRADAVTLETVEYIRQQPLIRAIIAGHVHRNYEGRFADRMPQIVTACTDLRLIEIV